MEQTVKVTEEIDEVVRLIPQERIQQRTVEQIVVVPVLQVVKEMIEVDQIIPGAYGVDVPVAIHEAKYQQSGQFRRQWRFFHKCSP